MPGPSVPKPFSAQAVDTQAVDTQAVYFYPKLKLADRLHLTDFVEEVGAKLTSAGSCITDIVRDA